MRRTFAFITLVILMTACSHVSPNRFLEYVNNPKNNLTILESTNDWQYSVQYRPAEYMALVELGNEEYDKNQFDEVLTNYTELDYFLFRMKPKFKIANNKILTENELKTYSLDWRGGIKQVANNDTLNPVLIQFENLLGVSGEVRFLTAFEKWSDSDKYFIIESFQSDTNIELLIEHEEISKLPELSI